MAITDFVIIFILQIVALYIYSIVSESGKLAALINKEDKDLKKREKAEIGRRMIKILNKIDSGHDLDSTEEEDFDSDCERLLTWDDQLAIGLMEFRSFGHRRDIEEFDHPKSQQLEKLNKMISDKHFLLLPKINNLIGSLK